MKYAEMLKRVKKLPFDKETTVDVTDGVEVYILRPSVLSSRFKTYDKKKNFQIWLKDGDRKFRPNHLRVFLDLNLRIRARPDLKEALLLAFDEIFYGESPEKAISKLRKEKFPLYLNSLKTIAVLAQLFIIEQAYGYHRESKFEPPTLFYQGWIREFLDSPKEIDNLCMSVSNGQPPASRYTNLENKKGRHYEKNRKKLWYL